MRILELGLIQVFAVWTFEIKSNSRKQPEISASPSSWKMLGPSGSEGNQIEKHPLSLVHITPGA